MGGLQTLTTMPWEAASALLLDGPITSALWFDEYKIKRKSARYTLFRQNNVCVCCGAIGTVAKLQYTSGSLHKTAHFNLYDENGLLFTKDHILAKASGGKNTLSNYQTMCSRCNNAKGRMTIQAFEMAKESLVKAGRLSHNAVKTITYKEPKKVESHKARSKLSLRFWSSKELLRSITLSWHFDKRVWFETKAKNAKNWYRNSFSVLWFTLSFSYTTEE